MESLEDEKENVDDAEAILDNDFEEEMQEKEPCWDKNCQGREEDETRMIQPYQRDVHFFNHSRLWGFLLLFL